MFEKLELFSMAQALARHGAARQALIAQNVANADTPGYRARDLGSFASTYESQQNLPMRTTRAKHLSGNDGTALSKPIFAPRTGAASPNGNNVSIEQEMFASVDAKREHDRALAIYRSSLSILRTSINGRG